MKINVRFLASIKNAAGTSHAVINLNGSTVGDVIDELVVKYGDKFREEIMLPDGSIKQSIKLVLNGSFIHSPNPLKEVLKDGDNLDLLTPFFGG